MLKVNIISMIGLLLCFEATAEIKYDRNDSLYGVEVQTGKSKSTRYYRATISKNYPTEMNRIKNSIINFQEKCNNSLKDRRKYSDKSTPCKYHNDSLVETFIIKDIKSTGWKKKDGEIERYLLGRQIYNRGSFGHYELVTITEQKNKEAKRILIIELKMLGDSESKNYLNPQFGKESAFDEASSTFILTEDGPKETTLDFKYEAQTQHWILNKEISVPEVFSNIAKSINDLMLSIDAEASIPNSPSKVSESNQ